MIPLSDDVLNLLLAVLMAILAGALLGGLMAGFARLVDLFSERHS